MLAFSTSECSWQRYRSSEDQRPHLPAAIRCSGAKLGAVSPFRIYYQRHRDELLIVLRKLAMHQTASPAWRATAGHISTPTSLTPAPACARTAAAAQLYSSIAATNPRRARLGPSSRASQQAPPNESSAAPAIRPTTNAADESSDTPSSNHATSGGDNSKVKPTPVSAIAVTISSVLPTGLRATARSSGGSTS
jgi:hypothetical protein